MTNKYDKTNSWMFIDLETSGLCSDRSEILEICAVVTDENLVPVDQLDLVIHHPSNIVIPRSSGWCKKKFTSIERGGNGLFNECHYSTLSYPDAEYYLWKFFEFHCTNPPGTYRPQIEPRPLFDRAMGYNGENINCHYDYYAPTHIKPIQLAGSTIHFDREFLLKFFPCLKKLVNHKVIDVTSILESVRRFNPEALIGLQKPRNLHRARDDIHDSILLLKYLKDRVIKK